ncbi:MAG TPA: polysaccharide biosynthesis protein [Clostridiales bacterium]|nr:polysaccharide biosynthesis protein [Clostridiales bacterium]
MEGIDATTNPAKSINSQLEKSININEQIIKNRIKRVNIDELLTRKPVIFDINKLSSYLENQVVVVTGGGGSIGSELCRQVASYNLRRLIIIDIYENNAYYIQDELAYKYPYLDLEIVIANVRDKERIDYIFDKLCPDVVFHAAAHKHVPLMEKNPGEAIKNNVFGTLNLVECSHKYNVKKFILVSTDKAVNPTSIMGATKKIAEMIVQVYDTQSETKFSAVRFGNVLGSSGSVVPLFQMQIERGGPVTVTHPDITRYFMTVGEAVQLVIQSGDMSCGGEIFVLDMGEPISIYKLARDLIERSGFIPDIDIKIIFTGLRPGEKLYEEPLLTDDGLQLTQNSKILITRPDFPDVDTLKTQIEMLDTININDTAQVKAYIKKVVPTYFI